MWSSLLDSSDFRRLTATGGLLVVSTFIGVVGYALLEGFTVVDAFYMTVITLSTVGYGEVHRLSAAGKVFTSIYIIFNLGIFAYFVSVIGAYLVEGKLQRLVRRYINQKALSRLQNHVIVCGYGRNGSRACEELSRSGLPFLVVEQNPDVVPNRVRETGHVLAGDATEDDILLAAGIGQARALITSLPKDADNVFIALTAREMNPNLNIVARASEESSVVKLKRAGATHVIMPDTVGGLHMANLIVRPEVIEFLSLFNGGDADDETQLEDLHYEALRPEYQGQTLGALNWRADTGVVVIAVKSARRAGFVMLPNADFCPAAHDVLILFGSKAALAEVKSHYCQ